MSLRARGSDEELRRCETWDPGTIVRRLRLKGVRGPNR